MMTHLRGKSGRFRPAISSQTEKPGDIAWPFLVPATGVISNYFLEDLEMTWALREVFPILLNSKILNNPFEK